MHDASGDLLFASRELDASRHFQRLRNRQRGEFGDRHAIHFHRQTFRPQPLALARGTFRRRHVIHQPIAIAFRSRLLEILFQVSEDSAETSLAAARFAVQEQILNLVRKLFKGRIEVDAVRRRRHLQRVDQPLRRRTRPQSAIEQRLRPIRDHFGGIEIIPTAEAVALGTSSIHAVERKRPRLELRHADAAIRTSQLLGIKLLARRPPRLPAPTRPPTSSPAPPTFPGDARCPASPTDGRSSLQWCGSSACRDCRSSSRFTISPSTRARV